MMKNSIGTSVITTIFGESHGPAVGAVIDGLAPGLRINEAFIKKQLELRKPYGSISTARREDDSFEILSGVFEGRTTGTPLCIIVRNTAQNSRDYSAAYGKARPGHADYTAHIKYNGYEDYRGGGHFSGRITAALTAAGAIAIAALKENGISIGTHIARLGGISDRPLYCPEQSSTRNAALQAAQNECQSTHHDSYNHSGSLRDQLPDQPEDQQSARQADQHPSQAPDQPGDQHPYQPEDQQSARQSDQHPSQAPYQPADQQSARQAYRHSNQSAMHHEIQCPAQAEMQYSDQPACMTEEKLIADIELLNSKRFAVLEDKAAAAMQTAIEEAAKAGDSLGGILETAVCGLPAGIGEPWFDTLEGVLAHGIFSIPGIKGVQFGGGFDLAEARGSEYNDPMYIKNGRAATRTNNNGGINGGISNGMPLIFRSAVKPTPSIYKEQETIDFLKSEETTLKISGRHDPAIIHRARVVVDSVTALVLCDMLAQRYGTDWPRKIPCSQ